MIAFTFYVLLAFLCLSECNLLAECAQIAGRDAEERGDVLQRGYVIELLDNLHRTFLMALEEWNARRVWSESRQFVAQQIFMTRQTNHDKRLVGYPFKASTLGIDHGLSCI